MPQSLTSLWIHLVFSTRNRERILPEEIGPELHAYMGGCLRGMECLPAAINTQPEHAHVLFLLGRTVALSEVVGGLKKGATEWLKSRSPGFRGFHWQAGYGAFSVSRSAVDEVEEYIRNQKEHHRMRTFQEEYRMFLQRHRVEFDERYVWD